MGNSNQLAEQLMEIAAKLQTANIKPQTSNRKPQRLNKKLRYRRHIEQLWLARYHRLL
jgi:hypothetical protein